MRVAVTGMGSVTPLGGTAGQCFRNLIDGRSGIRTIDRFDASGFATTFAGQIGSLPPLHGPFADIAAAAAARDWFDRKTELLLIAAQEALAGRIDPIGFADPRRVGLSIGSEGGRRLLEELGARAILLRDAPDLRGASAAIPKGEAARMRPSHPLRVLAAGVGARGPCRTVCTACTSSAGAIVEALRLIRGGEADVVLAGGTDTLVEAFMVSGFSMLGALSQRNDAPERASRPFDIDRDGFVLSEGAAVLVLEREEHAQARGAPILGYVLGGGMSNNAYRITDSPPDGRGPQLAMEAAMRDAGLVPADIGHINAHGTSTAMNDASESRGIKRALGSAAASVPVTSNKSAFGHLVAACGAVEAVCTILAARAALVPPTLNLDHQDPECDVDVVSGAPRPWDSKTKVALSNSFGFGGCNATLVLGGPDVA